MNKKVLIALVIGILMGLIIGLFIQAQKALFLVYSIDKIEYLTPIEKDTYGNPKTVWIVYGSTSATENIYLAQKEWEINQTILKQYGALPYNISTQSAVIVRINRYKTPYISLQVSHLNDYLVTKKVAAEKSGGEIHTEYAVNELKCSLWQVDSSTLKIHIPFKVQIYKKYPSGLTEPLKLTNPPEGCYYDEKEEAYIFDITDIDFIEQKIPKYYYFVNPMNEKENLTLRLLYPEWAPSYLEKLTDSLKQFLIVTPVSLLEVFDGKNIFNSVKKDIILPLIDYNSASSWKYAYYWFGDPNDNGLFAGHAVAPGEGAPSVFTGNFKLWGSDKGDFANTIRPVIRVYSLIGLEYNYFICEGYFSSWDWEDLRKNWLEKQSWVYEYPGWTAPDGNETNLKFDDPWNWRIPIAPTIISTNYNTKPKGYSLVDYIAATDVVTPVRGKSKYDTGLFASPLKISDLWSYNWQCDSSEKQMKYYVPRDSFAWGMRLEISSDLVDAVYVTPEQITKPRILNVECPSETEVLVKGYQYPVSITYINEGPEGDVGAGLLIPQGCPLKVGGDVGIKYVKNNETVTVNLWIENIGGLTQNTKFTVKFFTSNVNGIYDYKEKVFTLGASTGVGTTVLNVYTYDADTKEKLSYIKVILKDVLHEGAVINKVEYTKQGFYSFELGTFDGEVKVWCEDPSGTYESPEPQIKYVKPQSKSYELEFYLYKKGEEGIDWLKYMPYIIGGSVGVVGLGVGLYAYKKKKEVYY